MITATSLETPVSLKQAFMIMHLYLDRYWESSGKPEAIGELLSDLSLWPTDSGTLEPMDAAIFPEWLSSAEAVLAAEATAEGFRGANINLDGNTPTS